jgi:phosphatidyl-myo-inositol alpha-mannosyltransferase
MRITFVSPYDFAYPGGVTKHIANLCRRFQHQGHETCVIAPCSHQTATPPLPLEAETQPWEMVRVTHLVVPVRYNGSLARLSLSPFLEVGVRRALQGRRLDILNVHEPTNPTLPRMVLNQAASLAPGAAIVGTFHAYREDGNNGGMTDIPCRLRPFETGLWQWLNTPYRSLCDQVAARLDGHIAVSPLARDYASLAVPGAYQVIPNGVDAALFGSRTLAPLPRFRDGLNILFVGRLEPRKGFGYLLEAYARVKAAVPQVRLLVVGPYVPGDLQPFARRLRELSVDDVHFVGYVSEQDLARYYQGSHILCAPSTGSESFGMVLLEAMAAGTPIVASDIPGYRTVLRHQAEGLLVPPRNPAVLADALIHLLQQPDLRRTMGQRGQVTASSYTWERVADRVLDYYRYVLDRKLQRTAGRARQAFSGGAPTVAEQVG